MRVLRRGPTVGRALLRCPSLPAFNNVAPGDAPAGEHGAAGGVHSAPRDVLTLALSDDQGLTWSVARDLEPGRGAFETKHSADDISPPPPPASMSINIQGKLCSDICRVLVLNGPPAGG